MIGGRAARSDQCAADDEDEHETHGATVTRLVSRRSQEPSMRFVTRSVARPSWCRGWWFSCRYERVRLSYGPLKLALVPLRNSAPLNDNSSDEHLRRTVKKELRKRMRSVRNTLPASAIEVRSRRVVENVIALPAWRSAKAVALFWPIEGRHEIDVRPLFEAARAAGVTTFFPWTDAESVPPRLVLREVSDTSTFAERGHGYEEPRDDARVANRGEIDLVIVPALAVDGRGHRLGYGAGYYDRLLPEICPPAKAVVVALSFQLLVEVPTVATDVACDLIVTDERVIEAGVGVEIDAGDIELKPSEIDRDQPGVRVIQRPVRGAAKDVSVPEGTGGGPT